jgi:hypothetical protein
MSFTAEAWITDEEMQQWQLALDRLALLQADTEAVPGQVMDLESPRIERVTGGWWCRFWILWRPRRNPKRDPASNSLGV